MLDRQGVIPRGCHLGPDLHDRHTVVSDAFGLVVAGAHEQPIEPALEPIRVAKRSELPPRGDDGDLDSVLCKVDIAQDPIRDGHAGVPELSYQRDEGLFVTLLSPLDVARCIPTPRTEPSWLAYKQERARTQTVRYPLTERRTGS